MTKKIYALLGKHNVGKTATINFVYSLLIKQYPQVLPPIYIKQKTEILVVVKINGIKVGITSVGDIEWIVKKNLELLVENKCKLIVCTTRSYGKTVKAVEALSSSYKIKWIVQRIEPNEKKQSDSNENMANHIIEFLSKELDA